MPVLFALLLSILTVAPALAVERTFIVSPADVAQMVEEFNGEVLAHSATFGRKVSLFGGNVRFFGRSCPSVANGSTAGITRLRVLDGPARAALLAGRTKPDVELGAALQTMGGIGWSEPAIVRTRRTAWIVPPSISGTAAFSTAGFVIGDPTGKIDAVAATERAAQFLLSLDLTTGTPSEPADLVLALTTELPPTRPGRMPKRSECYLVGGTRPADVQALFDLVLATPLQPITRNRLNNILADARNWIANGDLVRASRAAKKFALEVANRSASEIPTDAAEAMITRGLLVTDALAF